MWKNLFYFTCREKSGLAFLILFIVGLFVGKYFFSKPRNEFPEVSEVRIENEVSEKADSFPEKHVYPNSFRDYEQNNNRKKNVQRVERKTYFEDHRSAAVYVKDSTKSFRLVEKYPEGTKVDINSVDTAGLMKIPGIGHSYATRILKYRHLLGGYYSIEQLKEVYGMYEELYVKIIPFLDVLPDSIVLISINKASIDRLKSHPYINFYQAKAILEMRKKKGGIQSLNELSLLEEFTGEELEKIKNYLSFD